MLPLDLPLAPMLARSAATIPPGMAYEPKWDGWRVILARDGDQVRLWSRRGTELTAFFPELVQAAADLPEQCVLDGETVIIADGRLEYTRLASRHTTRADPRRLARELPATFIAFDVLALGAHALLSQPWTARRELLEVILGDLDGPLALSPVTRDLELAHRWFDEFEGAGLDGVVAKPLSSSYEPGQRSVYKIKHRRTADVVVAGFRHDRNTTATHRPLGSLLLGLFDDTDRLHFLGVCSGFADRIRQDLAAMLADLELPRGTPEWDRHPWAPASARGARVPDHVISWREPRDEVHLISPLLVAEVAYDYVHGAERFRSNADFIRWRPDRDPASCGFDQLDLVPSFDVRNLLA